jgi:ATP-dependent Lhr-like helicase
VQRLRQEIEPVSTQDFMRFLFRWQHLMPNDRREGPDALDAVISQLQGFEAPVAAWETELLPARLDAYDMTWLDDLCLSGRAIWARLTPPGNGNGATTSHAGPIRTTPVALLPRRAAAAWHRVAPMTTARTPAVSARAQAVIDHLRAHGASFYDEIVEGSGLLRTQVEEALAELVAHGIATADSFAGLRALLTPSEKRRPFSGGRRHRRALSGIEEAGRWSLRRRDAPAATNTHDDPKQSRNPPSTWRMRCCVVTASCPGGCCSAKQRGCRPGAICCAYCADWKRAVKFAAVALSRASPANNSRCRKQSKCCATRGELRRPANSSSSAAPIL